MSMFVLLLVFQYSTLISGHVLCTDFTFPSNYEKNFETCPEYNGKLSCVSPDLEKSTILDKVNGYQVNSDTCKEFIRKVQCSVIDGWSAHLYDGEVGDLKLVPTLCEPFATSLYEACKSVEMVGNPFLSATNIAKDATKVDGKMDTKYATVETFLEVFSSSGYCFSGEPFQPPEPEPIETTESICIEKLVEFSFPNGIHINLVPVPGYDHVIALGSHNGYVALYETNSPGKPVKDLGMLIDISGRVAFNPENLSDERGLLGVVFHKDFKNNGRFFLSYTCAEESYCKYKDGTVVEEFSVPNPKVGLSGATSTKIIFTHPQPFGNHNGGLILFSPASNDPYLYIFLGDGGSGGDPRGYAQNVQSLLGKILRVDVDTQSPIKTDNGEYGIPQDNPFVKYEGIRSEIWALGLRNPWRCSFDEENPTYLYCGDVGQDKMEEIDLIVKGGNYGWKIKEGTLDYSQNADIAENVTTLIPPILEYRHDSLGTNGKASVTGGYVYRGSAVKGLFGKYIFADLYDRQFIASESPPGSGNFVQEPTSFKCSKLSPLECKTSQNQLYTFGQDNENEIYFISMNGVHRIVNDYYCSNGDVNITHVPTGSPTLPTPSPSKSPTVPSPSPTEKTPAPTKSQATAGASVIYMFTYVCLCYVVYM